MPDHQGVAALSESAVIVPIAEVESLVSPYRDQLDPSARWGVPAHVTVLYPFMAPKELTEATVSALGTAVASVQAFECDFRRTRRFGQRVLWLAPEPDGPFRVLTGAVWARFPDFPPYAGIFDDVVPHLTVGDDPPGGIPALDRADVEVSRGLPVMARVNQAWLMAGDQAPTGWRRLARLPLS